MVGGELTARRALGAHDIFLFIRWWRALAHTVSFSSGPMTFSVLNLGRLSSPPPFLALYLLLSSPLPSASPVSWPHCIAPTRIRLRPAAVSRASLLMNEYLSIPPLPPLGPAFSPPACPRYPVRVPLHTPLHTDSQPKCAYISLSPLCLPALGAWHLRIGGQSILHVRLGALRSPLTYIGIT